MMGRLEKPGRKECQPLWRIAAAILCLAVVAGYAVPARACSLCSCEAPEFPDTLQADEDEQKKTQDTTIPESFDKLEDWILNDVWLKFFPEMIVNMTHQVTVVALYQLQMIGAMMDAKNQLDTQRLFQELNARAHKDYKPSVQMCSFATSVRSLAAAERRAEISTSAMNRWAQNRHLGNANVGGAEGIGNDKANRLMLFRQRFCDVYDNNGIASVMAGGKESGLSALCAGGRAAPASVPVANRDKDIDYTRTIDRAATLDIDFTDEALWSDEVDLFALASNLYDHNVSVRIPETFFDSATGEESVLDMRSIAAKRGVAEQSLFAIAGMKTPGSDGDPLRLCNTVTGCSTGTLAYMTVMLKELGLKPEDILAEYGTRPSYNAQMEILTKKIYQNPDFYTDLYDSPANTERKGATLQAIGLMQDFDTLESYLRTEMMLSVMLELEIMKLQEDVKKKILVATSSPG